jgi:hypothetical protein
MAFVSWTPSSHTDTCDFAAAQMPRSARLEVEAMGASLRRLYLDRVWPDPIL